MPTPLRRPLLTLLCTLALTLGAAQSALAQSCDTLGAQLEALTTKGKLAKSTVGVHLVDLEDGKVLFAKNADRPMNPASNIKLITSAAALDRFGPNHTFYTEVLATAPPKQGTLTGSLYIQGSGEAFLLYEDVLSWASEIRRQGVTTVTGDLFVSDSGFDHQGNYLPPGFDQKSEDGAYRAAVSAVSVNFSAVSITISPGKVGTPATVTVTPPNDMVEVLNSSKTTKGKGQSIRVKSLKAPTGDKTQIVVQGTIGNSASGASFRKRIDHPSLFAASVLKRALQTVGVEVQGSLKVGDAPPGATRLVRHDSEPLTVLLMALNKWSNNFMAEQMLRNLSMTPSKDKGTWAGGRTVVREFLKDANLPALETLALNNGSGLYAGNLVSPAQFTALLLHMHRHRWAPEYAATMAIGGVDGTLARRFKPVLGLVRGKTGTLNEVTALSGYILTKSGRHFALSILINDPPVRAWQLRGAQDDIALAIASCT